MHFALTLVYFTATTWALQISSPAKGSKWNIATTQTVTFDSVSTDPTAVDVVLVNQHIYPPLSMVVGNQVETSSGSYSIPADKLAGLSGGEGFQVNLVSPTNGGILAQSGTFAVEVASSPPIMATSVASEGVAPSSSVSAKVGENSAVSTTSSHAMTSSLAVSSSHGPSGSTSASASTSATVTPNAAIMQYESPVSMLTSAVMALCMLLL